MGERDTLNPEALGLGRKSRGADTSEIGRSYRRVSGTLVPNRIWHYRPAGRGLLREPDMRGSGLP